MDRRGLFKLVGSIIIAPKSFIDPTLLGYTGIVKRDRGMFYCPYIPSDLVGGIQPMNGPTGKIFTLKYKPQ
jgi:hypothetical protein